MKKILLLFSLVFGLSLCMISCGSDDDDEGAAGSSGIVGNWVEDVTTTYEVFNWEFKADGTYNFYATFDGVKDTKWAQSGAYKISGDQLTVYTSTGQWKYTWYINNGKLYTVNANDGETLTYKRK